MRFIVNSLMVYRDIPFEAKDIILSLYRVVLAYMWRTFTLDVK